MHTEAVLEHIPRMPDGISLQPGPVSPASQLTQLGHEPEPSQAGTGAQPEQAPAAECQPSKLQPVLGGPSPCQMLS